MSAVGVVGRARARIGTADGSQPVAVQLESLRNALASVHNELDQLWAGHHELRAELVERLQRLEAEVAELQRQQDEQQEQARQVDARGFPLAAVGALVAGWPGEWLPWPLGVLLLGVGGAAAWRAVQWLRHGPDGQPGAAAEVRNGWADTLPPKQGASSGSTAPAEAGQRGQDTDSSGTAEKAAADAAPPRQELPATVAEAGADATPAAPPTTGTVSGTEQAQPEATG